MSAQMIEVPMKFELVRNGEVVETRRTRLVNPSFEAVAAVGAGWSRGKSTTLQYVDDEGDLVTMDTEGEWCECMRLWRGEGTLKVRLVLPSLEGGKGRGPCWWRKAERCRSRSRSRSRSGSRSPTRRCGKNYGVATWWQKWMGDTTGMWEEFGDDKEEDSCEVTATQAVVVEKILKKLHGEDTMVALASGTVDAKALGCKGWLSVKVLEDGEVDLDVKVRKLYNMLHQKGLDSLHSKDVEAVDWFTLCTELEPSRCVGWYNLSCALLVLQVPLQKGEAEKEQVVSQALEALEGAVKNGYSKWRHMATDPDLEEVRKNPRFLVLFPERIGSMYARKHSLKGHHKQCVKRSDEHHGHSQCKKGKKEKEQVVTGVPCSNGCGFETTGVFRNYCCKKCSKGKGHGKKCRQQLVAQTAPETDSSGTTTEPSLVELPVPELSAPEPEVIPVQEVPVPVEVAAPAPAEMEYAQQITALQGMGFPVDAALLAALKTHNGDLMAVVNGILM